MIGRRCGEYTLQCRLPAARGGPLRQWWQAATGPSSGGLYKARNGHNQDVVLEVLGKTGDEVDDHSLDTRCAALNGLTRARVPPHRRKRLGRMTAIEVGYLPGPSLAELMNRKPMDPRRATRIIVRTAEVLHQAADRGIHHGRVTPARIHVLPDNVVVVTGWFRGARRARDAGPSCIAPELADRVGDPVDERADVYSLACMLDQMLRQGRSDGQDADIPGALRAELDRATQSDPQRRHAGTLEFLDVVSQACPWFEEPPPWEDPRVPPPPPRRRRLRRAVLAAVAALCVGAVVWVATLQGAGRAGGPTVPVGAGPVTVVAAPDGRVFVANFFDGSVTVVDHANQPRTLNVGGTPTDLALDAAAGRLYVSDLTRDQVDVVDLAASHVSGAVPVGAGPRGIAVGAGGVVLVASGAAKVVSVIASGAAAPRSVVAVPGIPVDVSAAPPPDRAYVLTRSPAAVVELDVTAGAVVGAPLPLPSTSSPESMAVATDGRIYVADTATSVVWTLDPRAPATAPVPIPIDGSIHGMTLDPSTNVLYVASHRPDGIFRIDLRAPVVAATGPIDIGFPPDRLSSTPDAGTLAVVDEGRRTVTSIPVGQQ